MDGVNAIIHTGSVYPLSNERDDNLKKQKIVLRTHSPLTTWLCLLGKLNNNAEPFKT